MHDRAMTLAAEHANLALPDLLAAETRWLDWLRLEKAFSARTVEAYRDDLHSFSVFLAKYHGGPVDIAAVVGAGARDVRAWISSLAGKGHSQSSRSRAMSGLRSFLGWCSRNGMETQASVSLVRVSPGKAPLPRPLVVRDAHSVLESATETDRVRVPEWIGLRDRALFGVLWGMGLRIEEALTLDATALAGPTARIMGKGGKERIVPVLDAVRSLADAYLAASPYPGGPGEPLFRGTRGGRLDPAVAQRQMRGIRKMLGLPDTATPHALRHSFASHLLAGGANLREVQELLGHVSLSSTQRYTDVDVETMMRVYESAHPRAKR
jgi:integrase/recombinase XerC